MIEGNGGKIKNQTFLSPSALEALKKLNNFGKKRGDRGKKCTAYFSVRKRKKKD